MAAGSAGARLVGVGVGPGDPELLTTRALCVLRDADRVLAPTVALDVMGRAESVVARAEPSVRVERVVFAIWGSRRDQHAAHEAAAARVVQHLDAGEVVAFVTLGDPNLYSTFGLLSAEVLSLRPRTVVETVPGITAFQALAARAGVDVVQGDDRLHLVSAARGAEVLDAALADPEAAVVVYKGGRYLPEIAERLKEAGRLDGAVLGELLGLEGELVGALAEHADAPASYLATVILPAPSRLGGRGGGE
jgi:precorrin-2/cobalt-factor-2 C20-methyltransferase